MKILMSTSSRIHPCDNRGESFKLASVYLFECLNAITKYIISCVLYIINLSLENGSFPNQLKFAKVIPLHKGGPKKEIENWRTISVLLLFPNYWKSES